MRARDSSRLFTDESERGRLPFSRYILSLSLLLSLSRLRIYQSIYTLFFPPPFSRHLALPFFVRPRGGAHAHLLSQMCRTCLADRRMVGLPSLYSLSFIFANPIYFSLSSLSLPFFLSLFSYPAARSPIEAHSARGHSMILPIDFRSISNHRWIMDDPCPGRD